MSAFAKKTYIKNVLLPGFLISGLTGIIVGTFVFFFKWGVSAITELSTFIYAAVLDNPFLIPVLILGLAGLALVMSLLIKGAPAVGGGGIPTAEGILRGLITFKCFARLSA